MLQKSSQRNKHVRGGDDIDSVFVSLLMTAERPNGSPVLAVLVTRKFKPNQINKFYFVCKLIDYEGGYGTSSSFG